MKKIITKLTIALLAIVFMGGNNNLSAQSYIINTAAGNGTAGFLGDGGAATAAELTTPDGVCVDASGNIYISDIGNNRIRKISPSGVISTIAGNGSYGYVGDGGAAVSAEFNSIAGIALDASGNVYITDNGNNVIRKINTTGIITTIAGNGSQGYSGDGGAATGAKLNSPTGVTVDASGNIFIADYANNCIRKVNSTGVISTFAGNGTAGFLGDGGAATASELNHPYGVTTDASGNVYVADAGNNRIRKVSSSGIIATIAGNGTGAYSGDGGVATTAELNWPTGVTTDASGNIFIADEFNHRIRKVSSSGIISTIAGNGTGAYSGDGGAATTAELNHPTKVAIDTYGSVYISDYSNNRIRKLSPLTIIMFFASNTIICAGNTVQFTDTSSGNPTSWNWTFTGGTPSTSTSQNPIITYNTSGIYTVKLKVTNSAGTDSITKTNYITVNPLPTITVNSPTICNGTSTAITSSGGLTYSWNTGSTSNPITVNPTTTTNYTVTGTDGNGCNNTSVATVTVNPLPTASISGLSAICAGTMDTLVANASGSSPFTYNWSTSSTNDSIFTSTANTYSVTVSDVNGCTNTATASVIVNPLPTVTVTGRDSIISGTNDTLTASGGTSYVWTSGSTTDTTVVAPTATTTYSVTASNSFGCSAVDSFTVVIKITTGIANLTENNNTNLYPNPNNGIFTINFENKFAKNDRIEIYNVLGKMVNSTILNSNTTQINMKDDAAGIYMYKVLSENGSMISNGKIIVK